MQINIPIEADVSRNTPVRQYITARQGDGGAYRLIVSLKNCGAPLPIPSTADTVLLNAVKPDKTYVELIGDIENGAACFTLSANSIAVCGVVLCEVQVLENGTQLTSSTFEIRVMPTLISDDVIKSTSEFAYLAELAKICRGNAGINNVTNVPTGHMEGYGNRGIVRLDSRISYVSGKGYYCSEYDESLVGEHINVFLDESFSDEGHKTKYRGVITGIASANDGNGYKIYDSGEITSAARIMNERGFIPTGFYGSLIVHGGIYGDKDVDIPECFTLHASGAYTIVGLNGSTGGVGCEASGYAANADGYYTAALGERAHSDGYRTIADGNESHAENLRTKARGYASHSEGGDTEANGDYSHSGGQGTIANGLCQRTGGRFNVVDNENRYLEIIGNGKDGNHRSNAYTLDHDGNGAFAGDVWSHGSRCLTSADISAAVGVFALTNYIGGVSGGLSVKLNYPIEADGWRMFSGENEVTEKQMGMNEVLVTAPALLDGTMTIVFYRLGEEIIRTESWLLNKTEAVRFGVLNISEG